MCTWRGNKHKCGRERAKAGQPFNTLVEQCAMIAGHQSNISWTYIRCICNTCICVVWNQWRYLSKPSIYGKRAIESQRERERGREREGERDRERERGRERERERERERRERVREGERERDR